MLLPSEAVLSSLAEFVDRLATLADGRAIPAAQPAPAADDLRQTLAELTRLLYPTGAPLPPVDLMLGALPAPRRQVAVPEIDAVAVWVNAPEAFTGALRLILHNRGSTWLPAHSALQARLHLRGVDDMAPLALTVPHDLAPGETLSMSAQLPPSAENAVAVLELQTIDGSMVVRRDLGSVPKGSQP